MDSRVFASFCNLCSCSSAPAAAEGAPAPELPVDAQEILATAQEQPAATGADSEEGDAPFTSKERETLDYLYGEWTHPYFISIDEYARIMRGTNSLYKIETDDWAEQTIPAWRHSIWVGVWDPWPVVFAGPRIWYKTIREIVTLERMHRAFDRGLMTYGLIKGRKKEEIVRDKDDAFYSW